MTQRRALAPALAAVVAGTALAAPAAASAGSASISVDRSRVDTQLGRTFVFRTTVANRRTDPTEALVAHLNVLSLRPGVYVDPEDWSARRTVYLAPLPAGGTRELTWKLQAVNSGTLAAYVAVLPANDPTSPPAVGPTVQITVERRQTLDSGGILILAFGLPGALGLLAGGARFRRRSRTAGAAPAQAT